MRERELNTLIRELKKIKNQINQQDLILILKSISIALIGGRPNIYFEFLNALDIKEHIDLDTWKQVANKAIENSRNMHQPNIHQRD